VEKVEESVQQDRPVVTGHPAARIAERPHPQWQGLFLEPNLPLAPDDET
jgi:hypothetical protein